jgi:hypothetical protein
MKYLHPFTDAPENVGMVYYREHFASRLPVVIRDGVLYLTTGGKLDKVADLPADAVLEVAE